MVQLLTQTKMAVVCYTKPSLVFRFLSLPLFTLLYSHLFLESTIEHFVGQKEEIDGREKNDFMDMMTRILDIGNRLFISQVITNLIMSYKCIQSSSITMKVYIT